MGCSHRKKRWKSVNCLGDKRLATSFWQHNPAKANVCSQGLKRKRPSGFIRSKTKKNYCNSQLNFLKINLARDSNLCHIILYPGGHTIGTSHCSSFDSRLYNFSGKGDTDPALDPNYVAHLKRKCKPGDNTTLVEMDPGSFRTFDEDYYTLVSKRRGLFQSDAALLNDNETKAYVKLQATTHGSTFAKDFAKSMVKMGEIGVLTGNSGEIRKRCAFVN